MWQLSFHTFFPGKQNISPLWAVFPWRQSPAGLRQRQNKIWGMWVSWSLSTQLGLSRTPTASVARFPSSPGSRGGWSPPPHYCSAPPQSSSSGWVKEELKKKKEKEIYWDGSHRKALLCVTCKSVWIPWKRSASLASWQRMSWLLVKMLLRWAHVLWTDIQEEMTRSATISFLCHPLTSAWKYSTYLLIRMFWSCTWNKIKEG